MKIKLHWGRVAWGWKVYGLVKYGEPMWLFGFSRQAPPEEANQMAIDELLERVAAGQKWEPMR